MSEAGVNPARYILGGCLEDSGIGLQAVEDWYREERTVGEELADFLTRQGILVAGAARTVALIAKGYMAASCRDSILAHNWLVKLRDALGLDDLLSSRSVERPAPPPPAPEPLRTGSSMRSRGSLPPAPPPPREPEPLPAIHVGTIRVPARHSTITPSLRSTRREAAPPEPPPWPPASGTVLGKYLLTEMIGKGTSGLVFRAVNRVLNLSVAVKVLSLPEDGSAGTALESLAAEARLLASLNHPNVVRLWDFEADPATPYLVMEYVDGPSLAELIRQMGRLSAERAVAMIIEVAEGLAAAWRLGVVHRDVKPHNILIGRDGKPRVADLGLAVVIGETGRTSRSEVAGTAAYMSPEQGMLAGEPVDFRSDIYSLGATLYHALTGQPLREPAPAS